MKQVRNDSRYIIKRIIIGVAIALILGFIKTNNVFALEKDIYMNMDNSGTGSDVQMFRYGSFTPWDVIFDFEFFTSDIKWNFNLYTGNVRSNEKYVVYYNETLNTYFYDIYSFTSTYDDLGLTRLNCDDTGVDTRFHCLLANSTSSDYLEYHNSFFLSDSNVESSLSYYSPGNIYKYSPNSYDLQNDYNFNLYYTSMYGVFTYIENRSFFDDFQVIATNLDDIYVNGSRLNIESPLPSGYSEIDISNYQGAYFIPKDYTTIPTHLEEINNSYIEYIDFNFYLSGSVNSAYFNLENTNDNITFRSLENYVSFSDYDFIETSFPFYYNEISDDIAGFILFNTGNEVKIRYNSTLFTAYLVSDFTDYAEEITFIDENNEEVSRYISFTDLTVSQWQNGISQGGESFDGSCSDGGLCADNILSYIDFFTYPFSFLRSLNKNSCVPITLPLPNMIGVSLSIPCLSSIFKQVLGQYFNLISYVISGVIIYRVTLMNIDSITDCLDPNDDKLEVMSL